MTRFVDSEIYDFLIGKDYTGANKTFTRAKLNEFFDCKVKSLKVDTVKRGNISIYRILNEYKQLKGWAAVRTSRIVYRHDKRISSVYELMSTHNNKGVSISRVRGIVSEISISPLDEKMGLDTLAVLRINHMDKVTSERRKVPVEHKHVINLTRFKRDLLNKEPELPQQTLLASSRFRVDGKEIKKVPYLESNMYIEARGVARNYLNNFFGIPENKLYLGLAWVSGSTNIFIVADHPNAFTAIESIRGYVVLDKSSNRISQIGNIKTGEYVAIVNDAVYRHTVRRDIDGTLALFTARGEKARLKFNTEVYSKALEDFLAPGSNDGGFPVIPQYLEASKIVVINEKPNDSIGDYERRLKRKADELFMQYGGTGRVSGKSQMQNLPKVTIYEEAAKAISDYVMKHDPVNHPKHYTSHPSGIECIQITRHHNFAVGNAIKYLWRAGLKTEGTAGEIQDLRKAVWYIQERIKQLESTVTDGIPPISETTAQKLVDVLKDRPKQNPDIPQCGGHLPNF